MVSVAVHNLQQRLDRLMAERADVPNTSTVPEHEAARATTLANFDERIARTQADLTIAAAAWRAGGDAAFSPAT
jgi:hypothetical protein